MKGLVACWFYQVCIYFRIPVALQMCGLSLGLSWVDLLNEKFWFLWRHFCTLPSSVQAVYFQHYFTWPYKVSSPFGVLFVHFPLWLLFFHCFVAVVPLEMNNQTDVTEFIFLGFSNHPCLQSLFFLVFLVIYLTTLLGNTLIIMATRVSPALHIPMHYFLSNLSFLDICYSSTTIPGMLVNFFQEKKTISYEGCLSQIFFLVTCAGTEGVLLAAMAYDRYVAICHPLQYPLLMSVKVCVCLVSGSWLCGLENSMAHTVLATTLTLCGPNQISHFLCDIPFLLKLSCSDTSLNEFMLHVASATIGLSACLFTAVSYMLIISAILRIPSVQGRSKAFSTCASHLTVVVIFFGTANFNYDRPNVGYNLDMDILVSALLRWDPHV